MFDFNVHHVFDHKHSALDKLSRRLRESSDDKDEIHEKDKHLFKRFNKIYQQNHEREKVSRF